jgi:hypothetical protein
MKAEPRRRPYLRYWNVAALLAMLGLASWRGLRTVEYRRLSSRLGYDGPAGLFPIGHFRAVAPKGADPQQVWARMKGYDSVSYYTIPFVDGSDTLTVQRFHYRLSLGSLDVDVLYQNGQVHDVDVEDHNQRGMRPISATEAFGRLRWSPQSAGTRG